MEVTAELMEWIEFELHLRLIKNNLSFSKKSDKSSFFKEAHFLKKLIEKLSKTEFI